MQPDFGVESRSYDNILRGSWRASQVPATAQLGDEGLTELTSDCVRLWLPAGTPMAWSIGTRPLRNNCLQFFWPERWYMFSAFYRGNELLHTYAAVIRPATIETQRLIYVDLDLCMLVRPNLSYEVLTQAEFEHMVDLLHYSEESRINALLALETLKTSVRLGLGLFSLVPQRLSMGEIERLELPVQRMASWEGSVPKTGGPHAQAH